MVRKVLVALVLSLVVAVPTSFAHNAGPHVPGPYDSFVVGTTPKVASAGLEARIIESRWVHLSAATGRTFTIFGIAGEPFLRVGTEGTWELNAASATAHGQDGAHFDTPVGNEPVWVPASAGREVTWEDPRVRPLKDQYGVELAPEVRDVKARSKLFAWTIPYEMWDGSKATIDGELYYDPTGPSHGVGQTPALVETTTTSMWLYLALGAFVYGCANSIARRLILRQRRLSRTYRSPSRPKA